jgi:DNA invertase Pin-like site-specific DNA recombinase
MQALSQHVAHFLKQAYNVTYLKGGNMARMRDIKAEAKKKRAKLLAQFEKMIIGTTITEFAEIHGVTRSRISKQLNQAIAERNEK